MKRLLILFALTLSLISNAQTDSSFVLTSEFLQNKVFTIDNLLGLYPDTSTYEITERLEEGWVYGDRLEFKDSAVFYSFYTAPCGNDYFTNIYGHYEVLENNVLMINVKVVKYYGEWDKPTENREEHKLYFKVYLKEEHKIILEKF